MHNIKSLQNSVYFLHLTGVLYSIKGFIVRVVPRLPCLRMGRQETGVRLVITVHRDAPHLCIALMERIQIAQVHNIFLTLNYSFKITFITKVSMHVSQDR